MAQDYKKEYLERKESVLNCLTEAEHFCEKFNYEIEKDNIHKQYDNLKNGEFSIVVVGEFSSGKSTFLNAMMGKKILPSLTRETTATINFLRHKECAENGEMGKVFYRDGSEKVLFDHDLDSMDKIGEYVSTKSERINVVDSVSHLDLYLESDFLRDNVTLVDSPGLGGVAKGHREATESQIKKSSACIFLFSAEQPGSKTDFEVLDNLQENVGDNSIICVLNKIDMINEEEERESVESVLEILKANYKKEIPTATKIPEIIPISSRLALIGRDEGGTFYENKQRLELTNEEREKYIEESNIKAIEERLWRYLSQGERTQSELMTPVTQMENQLVKIKNQQQYELNALEGKADVNELEEQRLALEKQKENLSEILNEKTEGIKQQLKLAGEDFTNSLEAEGEKIKRRTLSDLDDWNDLEDIDSTQIHKEVQSALEYVAEKVMNEYRESVGNIMLQYGKDAIEDMNEQLPMGNIQFSISNDLEIQSIELGIEKYQEDITNLEKEIDELDNKREQSELEIIEAIGLENKKEELEEQLKRKKAAKEHYEEVSMTMIPDVYRRTDKHPEKVSRGGILGGAADLLFGKKTQWVEEEIIDDTERKEYLKSRNERMEKYDEDIDKLVRKQSELPSTNKAQLELYNEQIKKKQTEKEQELKRIREEFRKKSGEKIEKALKRQKRNVEDFIDKNLSAFSRQYKKSLRKIKESALQIITDTVANEVSVQIDNRAKEIELIQEKMKNAMEEKNNAISSIKNELQEIEHLLEKVNDLKLDLEEIDIDRIKFESL